MSTITSLLFDGTQVLIRPTRSEDVVLIEAMHKRLSPISLQYRYFRPHRPSYEEIRRIYYPNINEGASFVATIATSEEAVIGVACYVVDAKTQPITAEYAILIEDKFQGQGLGSTLSQHLSRHAAAQGINTLKAFVHPANLRMMRIFNKSQYPLKERLDYSVREMRLLLKPAPTSMN